MAQLETIGGYVLGLVNVLCVSVIILFVILFGFYTILPEIKQLIDKWHLSNFQYKQIEKNNITQQGDDNDRIN